jgi:hypothetical protein
MFDELPAKTPFLLLDQAPAPTRRGSALGPKLVLAVFVIALAFDLIGRVGQHLLARAFKPRARGPLSPTA